MTDEPSPAERTTLETADGVTLAAEQRVPRQARAAASIAHPHPQYGGTMHDAVVMTIERALAVRGVATVRFAFRGSGGSGGSHDGGPNERLDVRAALDRAASLAPGAPLLACGYSFGADVTLACDDERITAWIVAAPPLKLFGDFAAARDPRPKHLFVAAHDQYTGPDGARAATTGWPATAIHVVEMADHFFRGALDAFAAQLEPVLETLDL
jgi:alpha/beta superfamily hydrolase